MSTFNFTFNIWNFTFNTDGGYIHVLKVKLNILVYLF